MANTRRSPGPNADCWDWQLQAHCRGLDSAYFFHPDNERGVARAARVSRAKSICRGCPVRRQCRQHALAAREPYGIWGGLTEHEREILLRARNRQLSEAARVGHKSPPDRRTGAGGLRNS